MVNKNIEKQDRADILLDEEAIPVGELLVRLTHSSDPCECIL